MERALSLAHQHKTLAFEAKRAVSGSEGGDGPVPFIWEMSVQITVFYELSVGEGAFE